jgi:anti-sigma regulatory factor (Ser/Thr protein kinase)
VPVQAATRNELCLGVPIDAGSLADLRWRAWSYLAAAGVASGMIEDVLIALHEAAANALLHSGARDDVEVRVRARSTSVAVEVVDTGGGIGPGVAIPPRPPGLTDEGGRGLFMIWSLMSSVEFVPGPGTHLVMIKELYPRQA